MSRVRPGLDSVVVLGGGPAGLAAAHELATRGVAVCVLERAPWVGGLSLTWEHEGFRFDLVILDPPTFSTNRRGLFRAERDWPRLIAAACKVLESGGRLAVSSNTHHISKREMLALIGAGIDGKRRHVVKPEAVLGLPADFPISPNTPEMNTLQFIVTRPIRFR